MPEFLKLFLLLEAYSRHPPKKQPLQLKKNRDTRPCNAFNYSSASSQNICRRTCIVLRARESTLGLNSSLVIIPLLPGGSVICSILDKPSVRMEETYNIL